MGSEARKMLEAPSFSPRPTPDALRDEAWIAPLQVLARHRVEHVIVGDAASAAYGDVPTALSPLTIVPAVYGRNLERLTSAKREAGASGMALEVIHRPSGTDGYRDLHADARPVQLTPEHEVLVASAEDLDRMFHANVAVASQIA